MSLVIQRESGSIRHTKPPNHLKSGDPARRELLSWLQSCASGSSGRLSSWFGLRLLPSQTEQKSRSHFSNSSWSQFSTAPPLRNSLQVLGLGQTAQGPQEPENRSHHLNPDLNTSFGFRAAELSGGQTQLAFLKPDAVFDPKSFFIHRLGLAWRRQFDFRSGGNKDQPQGPFVTSLAVSSIFNHPVERKGLARPLSHPYIVPSADLDATAVFNLPFFSIIGGRQCSSVIEFDLSPSNRRTPETTISRRRQVKDSIVCDTPENRNSQLVNRGQKWLDCVLCIYNQRLFRLPSVPTHELLHLDNTINDRMRAWRNPTDFQWQCPTAFADSLRKHRQSMTKSHPFGAVHIAQLDRGGFRARVIGRIQNPQAPFPDRRVRRRDVLRLQPVQTSLAQILQPIILRIFIGQLPGSTIERSIEIAEVIAPGRAQRDLDSRFRSRTNCQCVDQIEQNCALNLKTLRDGIAQFLYTLRRGTSIYVCHTSSITLEKRLRGGLPSPFFV